jgi:hypothetical protein
MTKPFDIELVERALETKLGVLVRDVGVASVSTLVVD